MLTIEHRPSGLVAAREAQDEASVQRALKRLDGRLVLQKHRGEVEGGWVYKVVCVVSDRYAPVVLTWADEHGRPLPLTHALVEKMQSLRPDTPNRPESADEHNQRLVADTAAYLRRETERLHDEYAPYLERGRVSVSLAGRRKK